MEIADVFGTREAPWLQKGGCSFELRLRSARTTKDIELSLPGEFGRKCGDLERLQDRAATEMGSQGILPFHELRCRHDLVIGIDSQYLNSPSVFTFRYPPHAQRETKMYMDHG